MHRIREISPKSGAVSKTTAFSFFPISQPPTTLPIAYITNCRQHGNAYYCELLLPTALPGALPAPQSRITFIAHRHSEHFPGYYCGILLFSDSEVSCVIQLSLIESLYVRLEREEWIADSFSVVYLQPPRLTRFFVQHVHHVLLQSPGIHRRPDRPS